MRNLGQSLALTAGLVAMVPVLLLLALLWTGILFVRSLCEVWR